MTPTVVLDERLHQYTVDGVKLPGVNHILEATGFKDLYVESLRSQAWYCDRGRFVHKACELHDRGTLDEQSLDPVIAPYLVGWKKFHAEVKPETIMVKNDGQDVPCIELRMCSRTHRYCGTTDRIYGIYVPRFKRVVPTVVDIKTGAKRKETALQTAGYKVLADENYKLGIRHRIAVNLSNDGTYSIEHFDDPTDVAHWIAIVNFYHVKVARKGETNQ